MKPLFTFQVMRKNCNNVIEKIAAYLSLPFDSEYEKAEALVAFEDRLRPAKYKSVKENLFVVKQVIGLDLFINFKQTNFLYLLLMNPICTITSSILKTIFIVHLENYFEDIHGLNIINIRK